MSLFNTLWENHPTITDTAIYDSLLEKNAHPCQTGEKSNFGNQCAIRLGVCFKKSGINVNNIPGLTYCWQHEKSEAHVLRARDFADGLARARISGIGKLEKIEEKNRETFQIFLKEKTGVIFFNKFPSDHGNSDHIDLWNGNRMTSWGTWLGSTSLFPSLNFLGHRKSQEMWFWRVL